MKILETIFTVFVMMAAIYAILNIKDFIQSWYKWVILLIGEIWNLFKWVWNKIISLFKKG